MALTVIGVFTNAQEAQQAVEKLVSDGFSRSNIDLSARTGDYTNKSYDDDRSDPGVSDFFSSLFGGNDTNDAATHTRAARRGSVVTVHVQTQDEAEQAADILDDNGAIDVNDYTTPYSETADTGVVGTAPTDTTTSRTGTTINDQTIKVVEEDLQVGKREVERGGVRVRSRIVERPVEESLHLRQERVSVQRTPVDRPATAADLNAFQEGQIELVEHAEVPVVSKTAHVVEEITVGKEVTEHEEVVRDTVRKTEVDVEPINPTNPTPTTRTDLDGDVTYATR